MASIIKVDQLSEKTQGSGITLSHSLKLKSSGDSITKSDGTTAVLSESGGVVTLNNGTIGSGVTFPAGHTIKRFAKVTDSTIYTFYNQNPGTWPNNRQVQTASGVPAKIQVTAADLLDAGSSKLEITFSIVVQDIDYAFATNRRQQVNIGVNSSTFVHSSIPQYIVGGSSFYGPYVTYKGVIEITSPSTDTNYYYYLYSVSPTAGNNTTTLLVHSHIYSEYSIKEISQ